MKHKLKLIRKNNTDGITLIALVITIIVLLILAGVSIATLTGSNGLLTRANDAKIETALGAVKEALKLEQGEKVVDNKNLTPEILLSEGKVSRTVQQGENDTYYMHYAIKENAYEGMQGLGKGNIASLKDVFLIDDNLNVKYIASNGKEYGDNLDDKVLEDETEIRFSSKAFSEYISKISGVTEGEMKFKWMKNQTSLTITDPNVDSLQDLVFFPNLVNLQIGNDFSGRVAPDIKSLYGIENCTKLTSIMIVNGNDKDYSALRNLKNLRSFYRYGENDYNNIIDSLKFCTNMENLTLQYMQIEDMKKISELKNLKSLTLRAGFLEEIEGLENLNNLVQLSLSENKIVDIEPLSKNTSLATLDLSNNKIVDITPLSKNTSLTSLNLKYNTGIDGNRNNYTGERLEALNEIGKILDRDGGEIILDVDKLSLFNNYKILDLTNQNITSLEVLEGLTQLTSLKLSNNKITLEDLKSQEILRSMTNLIELNLSNNNIKNVTAINSLKNLRKLYLNSNNDVNLLQIEDIISNLDDFTVSTESFKTIINCDVNKITKLNIQNSGLTEIPDLTKFINLKELNLYGNSIQNYDEISKLSNLKKLNLSHNDLHGKNLNFSELKDLTDLDLSYNDLWSEDLEMLKCLKDNKNLTIMLNDNNIIDATSLLELDPNTRINLLRNVNLTKEAKEELKKHFQERVTF